jgi:hypothetical protein
MAYSFEPYRSPFANSIAETIQRRGDIAARQAQTVGAAQANAAQQSGQSWAHALLGATQALGAIPTEIQKQKLLQQETGLRDLQLKREQSRQAGEGAVDSMMRGDQLAPGATGPRQDSYLDHNGLFDIAKMTSALGSSGMGHLAPELLKGAEAINESILKHQAIEQQAAQQHTVMLGDAAAGALNLVKVGMPVDAAMDFAVQPLLATKRIQPDEYAQVKQQIGALPPEQQQQALANFMDAAAKLGGTKTLAPGATEVDRYGRTIGTGAAKPKTAAELAYDLSSDDPAVRDRAKKAIDALHPAPRRTDAELALDAYAKSIGKANAEDLTDADRQTFVKRDAQVKAEQAFQQHVREHAYDVAHPAPVKGKSQDELEQEARGVLQREFSSRSGGLGLEDQKVNQAIHLTTLLDQYEGKPMPAQIQAELALGLARLTSPSGSVGVQLEQEFNQRTAEGDVSKAVAWLTGDPTLVNASPEKLRAMFRDSIVRQGHVAEDNRQTYLNAMVSMLPTQLEESRKAALSKGVVLNRVDTVKMQAPNGQVKDVPRNQIEHFKSLGAKVIGG